jgi:hypothetical protein
MSLAESGFSDSLKSGSRRRVSIRRDDSEFVVAFQAEGLVAFRNADAGALRKVCHHLRREIVADSSLSEETLDWSATPIPIAGQTA